MVQENAPRPHGVEIVLSSCQRAMYFFCHDMIVDNIVSLDVILVRIFKSGKFNPGNSLWGH